MRKLLTLLALAGLMTAGLAQAATVTVNGSLATGGTNYATLVEALDAYRIGAWGDSTGPANADVIEITDDVVNVYATAHFGFLFQDAPRDDLIIRAAAGDSPVIKPTNPENYVFLHRVGTLVVDGLTFIGPTGANYPGRIFNGYTRGTLTIRNCILTANNGSDQPILDFRTAEPATGKLAGFYSYGGIEGYEPAGFVYPHVIENCTMAYWTSDDGAIYNEGTVTAGFSSPFTITNCLFINSSGGRGARIRTITDARPTTIDECAFININNLGFFDDIPISGPLVIEDTIFDNTTVAVRIGVDPGGIVTGGSVTLRRVTMIANRREVETPPVASPIIIGRQTTGQGTFVLEDVIIAKGGTQDVHSAMRIRNESDADGGSVQTLTMTNVAVVGMPPYSDNQSAPVKAAFDGLYGGDGPLTADPDFVRVTLSDDEIGMLGWHRETNDLYDVNSKAYKDMGTSGGRPIPGLPGQYALAGGADATENVPVELSSFSLE